MANQIRELIHKGLSDQTEGEFHADLFRVTNVCFACVLGFAVAMIAIGFWIA